MKSLFLNFFLCLILIQISFAEGEGTYGNDTYGNFSYGISSLANVSFSNSSVHVLPNALVLINATESATGQDAPNVILKLASNTDVSGSVLIVKYETKPHDVGVSSTFSALNRYIDIVIDSSISNSLNHSIIEMYYSDSEITNANIQENTLRLSKWNGTGWVIVDSPIGGVDIADNFVWANTSTFSTWGIFGISNPEPAGKSEDKIKVQESNGDSGYGWECSAWSECSPERTQSRKCSIVAGIGTPPEPHEVQRCFIPSADHQQQSQAQSDYQESQIPQQSGSSHEEVKPVRDKNPLGLTIGRAIQTIKSPNLIIAPVMVLVIGAFFAARYLLKKKKD